MNDIKIYLKDFTKYPGGRYKTDGPYSGEHFKEYILTYLNEYDNIVINLDGVMGLPSSFIDGCFWFLTDYKDKITLESIEFPEDVESINELYFLGDYIND